MAMAVPVKTYYELFHLIVGLPHFFKVILPVLSFIIRVENGCCETVIAGQNITLSCSLPSSNQIAIWTDTTSTVAEFSTTLARCEVGKQKCVINDQVYGTENLHLLALRNATHSWITVASDTPRNYTIACKSGYGGDVHQSFNLIFLDANKIQAPRCDIFPYDEKDTPKIKFQCEVDITREIKAELEIIGAGESIAESPDLVYSIVNYNNFVDAITSVVCRFYFLGINKSCRFPRGIRINKITEGDGAVFQIEANFDINDLVIDWQLVKIDKTVADITNYSLWYDDKTTSILFRNFGSRTDTEGIIVKCQITRTDKNQNISAIVGVGFISLESNQSEQSEDAHGATELSNGITMGNDNHDTIQEYKLYIMLACAFLGPLIISTLTSMWLIRKCGKKRQLTCVMSVKQVTLISTFYRGFEMCIIPRVMKYLAL